MENVQNKLAPIGICTYTRLEHLKKSVKSLQENRMARNSDLFMFSDGSKPGDESKVCDLRAYLKTITGFKSVTIVERDENNRVKNCRGGMKFLLEKYGKTIWLEEDVIVAPGFLEYLNYGLDKYKTSPLVLSICSYLPPLEINLGRKDAFFMKRLNAWGFAIWKDKFELIDEVSAKSYAEFIGNEKLVERVKLFSGKDLLQWFEYEALGRLDGLDSKGSFLSVTKGLFSLYPQKSLSKNVGHDGSGMHSGVTNKFEVDLWSKAVDFLFPSKVIENKLVTGVVSSFYSETNNNISSFVVENIVKQVLCSGLSRVSLWGTNQLSEMVYDELYGKVTIDYFIDSWPETKSKLGVEVISGDEVETRDIENIVVCSIANRFSIIAKIKAYKKRHFFYFTRD
jgi:hypothetical protein